MSGLQGELEQPSLKMPQPRSILRDEDGKYGRKETIQIPELLSHSVYNLNHQTGHFELKFRRTDQ